MRTPAGREQAKIAVGALLLFGGSLTAIRGFPSPAQVILASAHNAPGPLLPGQAPVQNGLPWEVFLDYFRLLLLSLLAMNLGAVLIYAGLTRKPDPPPAWARSPS